MESTQDIFIIGGGINGTGIAADAAGRGLRVTLCEKEDLASGTSGASTKLIHGGLRYLESFEFSMVRKSLQEQNVLLNKAPHLIHPLEFILPYQPGLRPKWLIRLGLFFYDHLANRNKLPHSRRIDLREGNPLRKEFKEAFSFYDCFTDDARLVIENALSAKKEGADIRTRTEFISAIREEDRWKIEIKDKNTQKIIYLYAKVLINATGPYVKETNQKIESEHTQFQIQLAKGSHIVVPKLYEGKEAYLLQHSDHRITFAIPYQTQYTLIGTTDINVTDPLPSPITDEEKNYLCELCNLYFKNTLLPSHILWSYSGIRCLQYKKKYFFNKLTRDYQILINQKNVKTPLVTIIGGKLSSFRLVSEETMNKLAPYFSTMGSSNSKTSLLPGGNLDQNQFKQRYAWLPESIKCRYIKYYGQLAYHILNDIHSLSDMGEHFGADLYEAEVNYLIKNEWAQSVDDILWRRTKLGLKIKQINLGKLEKFLYSTQHIAKEIRKS